MADGGGGNVLHHVKREGGLSRGGLGNMRGICPGGMSHFLPHLLGVDKMSRSFSNDTHVCVCLWLAVWLSGNALVSINVVALRQTRIGDRLWTGKPSRYVTSQLGRLSLVK